ncbi:MULTISPECIES: YchJ family protein [unclassified Streptomyces]|uniref:YchJ family protein n=1 Tax=unclassified Streptomyces TaxID=2593676 RepID=UPI002E284D7B|nr:YchJ family metal-binding protein [Streptomyces sp. NBC_00223]
MSRRPARTRVPASQSPASPSPATQSIASLSPTAPCPCGLAAPYGECCGAFHAGKGAAPTAERLMRSRYSAFVVRDPGYLLRTWFSGTRPPELTLDADIRWTGLDVLGTTGGSAFHQEATVDFRARFRLRGQDGEQRENSRFVRENGLWVYVDEAP